MVLAASAVPIVALAPVFTTMFGSTTEIPRRLVVTVVVIVPVFVSTARGLRQVHAGARRADDRARRHALAQCRGSSGCPAPCRTS